MWRPARQSTSYRDRIIFVIVAVVLAYSCYSFYAAKSKIAGNYSDSDSQEPVSASKNHEKKDWKKVAPEEKQKALEEVAVLSTQYGLISPLATYFFLIL